MTTIERDVDREDGKKGQSGGGHQRELGKRHVPFAAPFLVAWLVLPALASIGWVIRRFWDQPTGDLIAGCWMLVGCALAVVAVFIGFIVTKRVSFVVAHVAMTLVATGAAGMFITLLGWSKVTGVLYFFGAGSFAGSFALYRIDALRSAAAAANARDAWGTVIGLARSRPKLKSIDEHHAVIEVAHGPGETAQDVQRAAKVIESAANAIEGRTTVTSDGRAGRSEITLTLDDPFATWRQHPGPSHPGRSFAYPFRTAYYETGADQWFGFVGNGPPSPLTDFVARMDSFLGFAGATGAGKSGALNNLVMEGLTRTDVIVCWIDREKIKQNAGWCLEMLGMAGDDQQGTAFGRALHSLAKYRVDLFGQIAIDALDDDDATDDIGRKWTPELYAETGEAAVLAIIDEADSALQGKYWDWMAKRARSLGIFLVVGTPRASATEVPAAIRGSIPSWKTFAIGDNYSEMFTLSAETQNAGADPGRLREPGLHYLDRAPGVPPRLYPVLAREFAHTTKQLREWALAARATFTPATFTPGALAAMGADYEACNPRRLLVPRAPLAADDPDPTPADGLSGAELRHLDAGLVARAGVREYVTALAAGRIEGTPDEIAEARRILAANMTPADRAGSADEPEDDEMPTASTTGTSVEDDEAAILDRKTLTDEATRRELDGIDPKQPDPDPTGPPVDLPAVKPRVPKEQAEHELDQALIRMHRRGVTSFGNQDVIDEVTVEFAAATMSRRLDALAEGERIPPRGIGVEREGHGRFRLVAAPPSPSGKEN